MPSATQAVCGGWGTHSKFTSLPRPLIFARFSGVSHMHMQFSSQPESGLYQPFYGSPASKISSLNFCSLYHWPKLSSPPLASRILLLELAGVEKSPRPESRKFIVCVCVCVCFHNAEVLFHEHIPLKLLLAFGCFPVLWKGWFSVFFFPIFFFAAKGSWLIVY